MNLKILKNFGVLNCIIYESIFYGGKTYEKLYKNTFGNYGGGCNFRHGGNARLRRQA